MTKKTDDLYQSCKEEPSLIFTAIKQGDFEVVEKLINNNDINTNITDTVGNDIVSRLLKARQYDLVLKLMKKRNWDVNHQNEEGNTFGHILACDNSIQAIQIVEELKKKKKYYPNMKNNKGETALDLALNNNYLCTAFKILEDKRFNSIDIFSFKNLFNASIKNTLYGKYSKITNLEIIVENLEKKELAPSMKNLVQNINDNMDAIKKDIMNNRSSILESIINNHLVTA